MIPRPAFHTFCALQGGVCMSARSASSQKQVSPGQVWPALSLDLRTRVIGLLAHLALNIPRIAQRDEGPLSRVLEAQDAEIWPPPSR